MLYPLGSAKLKKSKIFMGYAVLHSEKGKSGSGGIGNHIDRKKGMEHTFPHADPNRINENVVFKVHENRHKISLPEAINQRIAEGYKGKRAIRKDAVKFTTHVLSGTHEDMKEIFKDKDKAKEWINANYAFVSKEFGKENIVRFNLHLDEKTPHIHVVTVPLTKDGGLSAREQFGNKTELTRRQDRYAEAMEPFELERGKRRTGITHEDAKEYYHRMKTANTLANDIDDLIVKRGVLGIGLGVDKEKTIESLKRAVIAQKTALNSNNRELEEIKSKLKTSTRNAEFNFDNYNKILSNDEAYKKAQDKVVGKLQREISSEIKNRVDYQWNLHTITTEERKKLAINIAIETANKSNTTQDIFNKALSQNNFRNDLFQIVERRAEKNLERENRPGRNRNNNLGY